MTGSEWMACNDPNPMLAFLWGKTSDRKLQLLACACLRRIWRLLRDERARDVVDVLERLAEGQATTEELTNAQNAVDYLMDMAANAVSEAVARSLSFVFEEGVRGVGESVSAAANAVSWEARGPAGIWVTRDAGESAEKSEAAAQANLLRDLVGNPFSSVGIDPALRTPAVLALAQAAYDSRTLPSGYLDHERLAILADALEEAGCDSVEILGHLRQPGEHVRGCWAVDLVLAKE